MTTVSAPGKVLLTGGYLVLERPNAGLVLGASARFHSQAHLVDQGVEADPRAIVHSPQFGAVVQFRIESSQDGVKLTPVDPQLDNKFAREAIGAAVGAAALINPRGVAPLLSGAQHLHVVLCADNAFYSQRRELEHRGVPYTRSGLAALPPGLPCRGGVSKTGLGSSATLTASAVAAVLVTLSAATIPAAASARDPGLALAHRVAQVAHARAQGKVGSGFDVCAAVYGSCAYVRPDPGCLAASLSGPSARAPAVVSGEWDHVVRPLCLPPGVRLLVGDVSGGSETPGMVRAVLAWRAAGSAQADALWRAAAAANDATARALRRAARLAACESEAAAATALAADDSEQDAQAQAAPTAWYTARRRALGAVPIAEWPVKCPLARSLLDARVAQQEARQCLREVGLAAGVPVEPPEQSARVDASLARPGVLLGGVPGAGGHDAIAVLVVSSEAADALARSWEEAGDMCALPLHQSDGVGLRMDADDEPTSQLMRGVLDSFLASERATSPPAK